MPIPCSKFDIKMDGVKIGPTDWTQEYKNVGPLTPEFSTDGNCTIAFDVFGDTVGGLTDWLESGGDDVTKPVMAIGSGTTEHGGKNHGEFHINWQEGYLESLTEGVVELASTESEGVRYRFCVERVKE